MEPVGAEVGETEGLLFVGCLVGLTDGKVLGVAVGFMDGKFVGLLEVG